jgi:hypothetical protein
MKGEKHHKGSNASKEAMQGLDNRYSMAGFPGNAFGQWPE